MQIALLIRLGDASLGYTIDSVISRNWVSIEAYRSESSTESHESRITRWVRVGRRFKSDHPTTCPL